MGSVLITGGSGGIGRAAAAILVQAGHQVTLTARNEERLRAVAAETGASAFIAADCSEEPGVARIMAQLPRIDVLVHAVGLLPTAMSVRDETPAGFDAVVRANLRSTFLVAQAALPRMPPAARIILVSSTSASRGLPGFAAYSASKGGMRAMAGAFAGEVARQGINVSILTPGPVDTEMFAPGPAGVPLLQPDEVGEAVRFLVELPPSVTVEELTIRANSYHARSTS